MSNVIHFPGRPTRSPLAGWNDERRARLRRARRFEALLALCGALLWFATAWLMLLIL